MKNKYVAKFVSELYLEPELADVQFAFTLNEQTVNVPANKLILGKASPVFKAMFFGPLKLKGDIVNIFDFGVEAFKEFLQFFYLSEVGLTMENIEAVVRLADMYDMAECLEICVKFLKDKLTRSNMIWGYQLAHSLNIQNLMDFCQREIQLFTGDEFKSDQFLRCGHEAVKSILRFETMLCTEAELFDACIAWAKFVCQSNGLHENNPQHLKKVLGDCLHFIRFAAMGNDEIGNILSNKLHEKLFNRKEVVDIMHSRVDKSFVAQIFKGTPRSEPTLKFDLLRAPFCNVLETETTREVQDQESIWFTTNVPVLLGGEITVKPLTKIHQGSTDCVDISFTISVIEFKEQSFEPDVPKKTLHTGTVDYYSDSSSNTSTSSFEYIRLPKPIVIHGNRMYELQLKAKSDVSQYRVCSSDMKPIQIDEEITIEFKNPSADEKYDSGLILSFQCNQIKAHKPAKLVECLTFEAIDIGELST